MVHTDPSLYSYHDSTTQPTTPTNGTRTYKVNYTLCRPHIRYLKHVESKYIGSKSTASGNKHAQILVKIDINTIPLNSQLP